MQLQSYFIQFLKACTMKQTSHTIFILICFVLALSKSNTIDFEYDDENESDEIKSEKVEEASNCGFGWLDSPYGLGTLFSQ